MAANPDVVKYLKEQVKAGFSKEQVYHALLAAGWTKEQVNEAIYEIMGKRPESAASAQAQLTGEEIPGTPGFLWKLKNSLFHPDKFFEAVKAETGIKNPFIFMLAVSLVNFLAIASIFLYANRITSILVIEVIDFSSLGAVTTFTFAVFVFVYIAFIGLSFLLAAIAQGFVRVAGGKNKFYHTYKGMSYAYTPLIFMPIIFALSFLLLAVPEVRMVLGGIELLIGFWGLYLAVRGISKFQEISVIKSLIAVALTSITLVFILFLGVFYFLYYLLSLLGLV